MQTCMNTISLRQYKFLSTKGHISLNMYKKPLYQTANLFLPSLSLGTPLALDHWLTEYDMGAGDNYLYSGL